MKLNAEKDGKKTAEKYKVQGYPTILFINAAGEVEGRIGGYMPPEGFAPEMERIAAAHREFPALQAKFKANPNDPEIAAKLAAIYAGRGRIDQAESMLAVAEKAPGRAGGSLAVALNAVADHYQLREEFGKAIPLFEKAAKVSQRPHDTAYAWISVATCYFQWRKPKEAVPALEKLLAVEGAPKDWVEQGKQMLQQAKRGE